MNLITLYKNEATQSGTPVVVMALISGVFQGLLLGIITHAASAGSLDSSYIKYLLLFFTSFAIAVIGKRYALMESTIIAEKMIKNVRIRISNKIRHSELLFLENIGKSEIYTLITQNTNLISESIVLIMNACQSAIVLVFCLFYIAYLSQLAFFITVGAAAAGIFYFMMYQNTINAELRETTRHETFFFDKLYTILDGFKELKMNRKKSDDFFECVKEIADETETLKIKTGIRFVVDIMFSQVFFYLLIAVLIFLLPKLNFMTGDVVIKVATATLFIIGPANQLVNAIPLVSRANIAVENVYSLEKRLDEATVQSRSDQVVVSKFTEFNTIEIIDLRFSYLDHNGSPLFSLGPLNMTVSSGDTIFIVGGNGSGKSSFMKLLTGLYYPESGKILVDGTPVTHATYPAYRELFSVIFGDFHLFDKLYGLDFINESKVADLLKMMQLDKKTELKENGFTNINLSTGQRKRLAMIVAMLENKPISIFDEWAADQDPIFREYFYTVLLKQMKSEGRTVIAVSHDDRYFDLADKVIKMEYGQIVSGLSEPV